MLQNKLQAVYKVMPTRRMKQMSVILGEVVFKERKIIEKNKHYLGIIP